MNPRTETIAFRIWAYCTPVGWDRTMRQIADDLDLDVPVVRGIMQAKRWSHRARRAELDYRAHVTR